MCVFSAHCLPSLSMIVTVELLFGTVWTVGSVEVTMTVKVSFPSTTVSLVIGMLTHILLLSGVKVRSVSVEV